MRRAWMLVLLVACGGGGSDTPDPGDARVDSPPSQCKPIPAQGQFVRREGNPRLLAGSTTFSDGKLDIRIGDPDLRFDPAAQRYELYYSADHATAFGDPSEQVIRHATSLDRLTWTVTDTPVLTVNPDVMAWDHTHTDAPTVVFNPDAPADRRFLLLYAGAARAFPHPGYAFPEYSIGAAFSADGVTFTRVPAASSPHGQDGLVITGAQVYPGAVGATVSDPELAFVDGVYHLWFSSFGCEGTSCATVTDFGVVHATSGDGITWTILEAPVKSLLRASSDDRTGGSQPSVIHDAEHCRFELWQTNDLATEDDNQPVELENMVGVWKAESTNATQWSIFYTGQRDVAWSQTSPAPGERLGLHTGADVALNSTGRLMLYVGFDDQNVPAGSTLPTKTGTRAGVMTLNIATRDLP
jgi:hypothetical protein